MQKADISVGKLVSMIEGGIVHFSPGEALDYNVEAQKCYAGTDGSIRGRLLCCSPTCGKHLPDGVSLMLRKAPRNRHAIVTRIASSAGAFGLVKAWIHVNNVA